MTAIRTQPSSSSAGYDHARDRVIFSFIVDAHPRFAYEGYHLARSIRHHCGGEAARIHAHVTPGVKTNIREVFVELGCDVIEIEPFGDGRYCNKIAQLAQLAKFDFDLAVLLDTDTILVDNPLPHLNRGRVQAKIVDLPNPPLETLRSIAALAGIDRLGPLMQTDAGPGETFAGNCNGGFYAIPREHLSTLATDWQRWALWLLQHPEPLRQAGMEVHVDQVAMWLALASSNTPWSAAPSNLNYYVHFDGPHRYHEAALPICMLHYHQCLSPHGMIQLPFSPNEAVAAAVAAANQQIAGGFQNTVFWNFRYARNPDLGSGVGSRGDPLRYKRDLLRREGLESARSILDLGCGDLEVLRCFDLSGYLGLDVSDTAIAAASAARPDLQFRQFRSGDASVPECDFVLCLEVLIHQPERSRYLDLIGFLAQKTKRKLIVSGYAESDPSLATNHMIYYHEPLETSLRRTGRFGTIEEIGAHTTVKIYRCLV